MEHIKQFFHWSHAIAPLISLVIAFFISSDEKIIEYTIITLPIVINLIIIFIQSFRHRTDEKDLIFSIIYDELLPNKTAKELNFNAQIVIVQHENDVLRDTSKNDGIIKRDNLKSDSFYYKLDKVFSKEKEDLSKLTINLVPCKS